MTVGLKDRIRQACSALGAAAPEPLVRALTTWLELIKTWNAHIDLTAARTDDELVDIMLADALVLGPRLPEAARVVDVGSGAGAPGLPIALARADLRVTLVEPLQKRVAFLRTVIGSIVAPGAAPVVERARGEDLAQRHETFDVALSRAVLAPQRWVALGARLAAAGDVWVLLARENPPALRGRRIAFDLRYVWPLTGAERRAVRYAPELSPQPGVGR